MPVSDSDIHRIMQENRMVLELLSGYLNHHPRFLDAETVNRFAKECQLSAEEAFLALFCAACGLDSAEDRLHRSLEKQYFRTGVRCLSPDIYQADPYYRCISFPAQKKGSWEMKTESYLPFEPFVYTHLKILPDLREIPQIGYFQEPFPFPAVLENGVEWMTVTPNEIETMRVPISKCHGNVLTLGLGLGYFAFHAAIKDEVLSVTVIEKDRDIISLFTEFLLPQFPHKEKIRIVEADAFVYLKERLPHSDFDYLFADLWHDASDGLEMYIRLKKILSVARPLETDYWIEPSLLSALRHLVYDRLTSSEISSLPIPLRDCLTDSFLKQLDPRLD